MYGSATVMGKNFFFLVKTKNSFFQFYLIVLSTGNGVNAFTLDPSTGEFVLTHKDIKTPKRKNIYSINEGYAKYWYPGLKKYVEKIKNPENEKQLYSQRYVGSMVADVHRTLLYGGIFMYPPDTRSAEGKLRLLYEANPMSFILEQAGGKSTTGKERILDIKPNHIHQRVPVFLGSSENIDELQTYIKDDK